MQIQELLSLLETHSGKELMFQYDTNKFVGKNYHITEVKHLQIDSVDCGARTDAWNETIIQLWEAPSEVNKTEGMSALKALGILKKVGRLRSYDSASEVRFEYGNEEFHTAQLFVNDYEIYGSELRLNLAIQKTECKAKEACGLPSEKTMVAETSCCTPDSGCC
ncbi:DUF6428 family protein [Candidatus Ulvibacter alkanivorans]|uniref:DUF6428 family protein n=1 Tax=Candidatus Ulvibacter alkanivorans TaxID=2267620 RepID=UPI000DF4087E|nr:DUF6428 family protein [Candidatus Ulvibacter alkanivorans]